MLQFYDPDFVYKGKKDNTLECEPSNQDLTDSSMYYCGFVSPRTGAWIIQRIQLIGDTFQHRYAAGRSRSDYDAHWNESTGRYVVGSPELTFTTIDQVNP